MNLLELFMRQVKETTLSYEEARLYLEEDRFTIFVKKALEELYHKSMTEHGDVVWSTRYTNDDGTIDLTHLEGFYDLHDTHIHQT